MAIKLKNNVSATLATSIGLADVGLVVTTGQGDLFPALGAGEYFYATLVSSGGAVEIVKVTARVVDTMTIVRAQEGTTASNFSAGAKVELRVTAQSVIDAAADAIDDKLASQAEAEAGTNNTTVMTPLRVAQRETVMIASQAEAEAGTDNTKTMTPLRVAQRNAAIIASQAEAEAGSDNTKTMTPLRVAQRGTAMLASQAEATAGVDNTKTMTPLRVQQGAEYGVYTPTGTGVVATTIQAKLRRYVDAKDFGALGNDSNDDTAELQAALNAANNGTCFIPDGTYLISAALTVPIDCAVRLASNAVIRATLAMDAIFVTGATDTHVNNSITGGYLDCNDLADSGIWVKQFDSFLIDDVEIVDNLIYGVRLGRTAGSDSFAAHISNLRVTRALTAVPVGSTGIYFERASDCSVVQSFIQGQQYAVSGAANLVVNTTFTNVRARNLSAHGDFASGFDITGTDNILTGCTVEGDASGQAFNLNGTRNVLIGCATKQSSWGTDNAAPCVTVAANCHASISNCVWKGYSGGVRWQRDVSLGSGATMDYVGNRAVNVVTTTFNPFLGGFAAGTALLTSGTVSSVANLALVLTAYTGFKGIVVELIGFVPATDGQALNLEFSTDGGSTYINSGYNFARSNVTDGGTATGAGNGSTTSIALAAAVGNLANEGFSGSVKLTGQTTTTLWPRVTWNGYFIDNTATPAGITVSGGGSNETAQDVDAIRFSFASGNIASGSYAVYGLR